jgi:hypothetical protein
MNGIQDPGEPGIRGTVVQLFDCDDTLVSMMATCTDGYYRFTDLVPGDYYLLFRLPDTGSPYVFSPPDVGDDDHDSDVDPATGRTICFTLNPGDMDISWDAGAHPDVSAAGEEALPAQALLHPNAPNPFNPATSIAFDLPAAENVTLTVYSVEGRLVKILLQERLAAGRHVSSWNGRDARGRPVASGTYIYRLQAGSYTETKRMVLIK